MMGQAQARTKKRDASLICWDSGKFYNNHKEAKPRGCTDLCRSVLMKPRTEHGRKAVHAGECRGRLKGGEGAGEALTCAFTDFP